MSETLQMEPVAYFRCGKKYRFEAPRQGVFSGGTGTVEFLEHRNFETALADLQGFERVWLIFGFHLNHGWKPKVSPPVITPPGRRVGVFATRSPHRPNPVGLSCVRLDSVAGLLLHVSECDLLDGSPVYDVKPYIPAADAFPEAGAGWTLETLPRTVYELEWSAEAALQAAFLLEKSGLDLKNFCALQLSCDPLSGARKRIYPAGENYELGCRTWRIVFACRHDEKKLRILRIRSHYQPSELVPDSPDRYGDKEIHRSFLRQFSKDL